MGKFIDALLVVEAATEHIKERTKKRKIPVKELEVLLKFQRRNVPMQGISIENNGTIEQFYKKIDTMLTERYAKV